MGRFDRYLLAQLLTHFGFFALVLILVYWINRAVTLFDQLVGDGESISTFLELTALTLPSLIRIVLPIAAFAASLYVTNRLIAESELVVVQATGFSPLRLARPYLAFGLIATLLVWSLTQVLVPAAATRMAERQAEIAQNAAAKLLRDGRFLSPAEGVTVYIREITPTGELKDLFLSDSRSAGSSIIYTATSAYLVRTETGPQLVMVDGMAQTLRRDDQSLGITSFTDLAYDIGALIQTPTAGKRTSRQVPTRALLRPTPALEEETGRSAGQLVAEGHDRFAQGFLALVGALLGFSTLLVGSFSRFGVWRQIIAAVFLIIFIKVVEAGTTSAVRGDPRLWPLIYLPSALGMAMAWGALVIAAHPPQWRRRRAQAVLAAGGAAP